MEMLNERSSGHSSDASVNVKTCEIVKHLTKNTGKWCIRDILTTDRELVETVHKTNSQPAVTNVEIGVFSTFRTWNPL